MEYILSINEVMDIIKNPYFIILGSVLFILLSVVSVLFFKEHVIDNRKNKAVLSVPISKYHIPAKINLSIEEILEYFDVNYNFKLGSDTSILIKKLTKDINKLNDLLDDLTLILLAAQTGISINKKKATVTINEAGALSLIVENELDIVTKLLKYLSTHDIEYQDDYDKAVKIKNDFHNLDKRLIATCISLIVEIPNSN
jgi:hypothetical protein